MKVLLKVSFALLTLIVIAIAGFAFTFNPNDYKDDIINIVKENTGRQLSIPGDISLSLFPWIGLDLGKIEISNAKGFSKKPFAKMNHLQVRAKLWPLFLQQLEADTFIIEGLTLNLAKNKSGKNNWDDLLQSKKSKATSPPTKTITNNKPKVNLLAAFAINGIKISQSQFNFDDQQKKQTTSLKNIQLETGHLKADSAIPFKTQFEIHQTELAATIKLENKITFSPDFKQFSFQNLDLNSKVKLATLKKEQNINISSKLVSLDLNGQTVKSKKIAVSFNDAKLSSSFSATKIFSTPTVKAQLDIETFNPQSILKNFDVVLPAMADEVALTKFNAKMSINASTTKVDLSNIKITLDDSQITGNTSIKLPSASTANLNINSINLDRYLPPIVESKNKKQQKTNAKTIEPALIPVALLTTVDLAGKIKINELQIKNTHWKNLLIVSKAKQGNIDISTLKLQGYGSTINSSFKIKTTKQNATLSAKLDIKDIKSGEALKDFMAVKNLQGLASFNANINTKGIILSQLKKNLNGKARFKLKDGIVKGFDLEYEIGRLDAKIKRKPIPAKPSPLQTKLTNLSASAIIKNGIIHNKDLRAATPFTRIIGQGNINLPKEQLNYVATVKLTNTRDIQSKKTFEQMSSIPLDVHIRGTFDKPEIKADFNKALKTLAKKEVDKHKKKTQQKAKDKLKQKLEDKLKNLFKF